MALKLFLIKDFYLNVFLNSVIIYKVIVNMQLNFLN